MGVNLLALIGADHGAGDKLRRQVALSTNRNRSCAGCHTPVLHTQSRFLKYSFPEVETDPTANVFYAADLTGSAGFKLSPSGGVSVRMFSDLKRHQMGPALEESTGDALDPWFITARLWGIADTAPYLHDGRALTLSDAILDHGGEGTAARNAFAAPSAPERVRVLAFLRGLRTPKSVAKDILPKSP